VTRMVRHLSGQLVQVEYADNPLFTGSTLLPAVPMDSGSAEVTFELPSGVQYWRTLILDSAQSLLAEGRTQVVAVP
jgi:hypothetical protein